MQPWLAESWNTSTDGRSISVRVRPRVTFPDGAVVDAEALARMLPGSLKSYMGPIASDLDSIRVSSPNTIEITFKHKSQFLLEALEGSIQSSGTPPLGTGPYVAAAGSMTHMRANSSYYLGKPAIDEIDVATYPSVRAAWADLLRGKIDMLWEVDSDALDSMTSSSSVSVFTYTRRYQHALVFNPKSSVLRSSDVRRALNGAINRDTLVRNAFNGHAVASSGLIWPQHWALSKDLPKAPFDPAASADTLRRAAPQLAKGNTRRISFTCLVPPDAVNERVALEVKRQLEAVGADMAVEELPQEQLIERLNKGQYDATLFALMSGPNIFRPYLVWHSNAPVNWGKWGSENIDRALDAVRFSGSEAEYVAGVANLNRVFVQDPPAIFLAWQERARAVSRRFSVPSEPGRDILGTLRLWKPAGDQRQAKNN